jgi:N-terminal domain of NWD NACHT-NTPase
VVIPSKQRAAQSKGLSDVADLIQHYSTVEKVYRGKRAADTIDQDFKDDFEDKLTMLYSQILEYQAQTICQISRNVLLQSFSLPSTWESLLAEIKNSDAVCKQKMGLLSDFRINEVRIETQNLSRYLETRFNDLVDSSLSKNPVFHFW